MKESFCTDLEQSKRVAKILPEESSDLCYSDRINDYGGFRSNLLPRSRHFAFEMPAWSTVTLMRAMKSPILEYKGDDGWSLRVRDFKTEDKTIVECCVKMIELLHEENVI